MRIDSNAQALQYAMSGMSSTNANIQSGFNKMSSRENPPNHTKGDQFTSAFVEEIYLSKVAQAQLVAQKTKDEVLDTTIDIYA